MRKAFGTRIRENVIGTPDYVLQESKVGSTLLNLIEYDCGRAASMA